MPAPNPDKTDDLSARLAKAADAKKAILAKFKSKPAAPDPNFMPSSVVKEAELVAVRQARADAKEAARLAKIEAEEVKKQVEQMTEEEAVAAQRAERKARKAALKSDAKARREASQATRMSRRVG